MAAGFPSSAGSTEPLVPMLAKLKLNAEALRLTTSLPETVGAASTVGERKGKRKGRSSAGKQAEDDSKSMPWRIVRAFVATKIGTMLSV